MDDTPASTLGRCPVCETELDAEQLLAQYVRADATTLLAGCPECWEIVQPIGGSRTSDRLD